MDTLQVHPYLFFGGNCREAMEFYKALFGGQLELKTFGDGPPSAHADAKANSAEVKDKIMHARLDGAVTILASDNPHHTEDTNTQFSLSIEGTEETLLTDYFNRLDDGGLISAPLDRQFWGDIFGMVKDKYGIAWMITIKQNQ